MKLILASQSPRRMELLRHITTDFVTEPSYAEESIPDGFTPAQAVQFLAQAKAHEVAQRHPDALVIGSDTVVSIDGKILGKPRDKEHCIAMLHQLSGRVHEVYTGVSMQYHNEAETFYDVTQVEFYPLSEEDILWYAGLSEPYDKAGGYGIQGRGCLLVRRIIGDYYNVMGFPVAMVARRLRPHFSFTE